MIWPLSLWFGVGSRAFHETIEGSIDRANVRFIVPYDSRLYIGRRTRKALVDHAEWLWQNFGIVKEGVAGIARHTIGKGISLQIDSIDPEWNDLGEADFENYALTPERCDLAGRRNFYEAQTTAVEQRLVRGEFFCAKTENPAWGTLENPEPCFFIYDSEEIGTPLGLPLMPEMAPKDSIVLDGVEMDGKGRATGYWVRDIQGEYHRVDRSQMIHWYKPHAINQSRGITDFAQAVNNLVDIHEMKRLTVRSAKAQQLIALVMKGVKKKKGKGAYGAIANAGTTSDGSPDPDSAQLEKLVGAAGAGILYLEDPEGDAKLISPNSPTPLLEGFVTNLLMRDVCASWGVPSEFFWDIAKLNGGNTRFILSRADLFFQLLGDRLIDHFCTPIAFRYLSHRIQIGALPEPKDPNWALKLGWQLPPRVTVDNGREAQILIEFLSNGMTTLREYCNARGMDYRTVMRQWVREPIEFLKIAEQEGAPPEMIALWKANPPMWRASKPGAHQALGSTPEANATTTEQQAADGTTNGN